MKKKIKSPRKLVTFDEVIVIPKFYPDNLTLDQMHTLQDLLERKAKHEELRRENQQRKVLHDIKDIYF